MTNTLPQRIALLLLGGLLVTTAAADTYTWEVGLGLTANNSTSRSTSTFPPPNGGTISSRSESDSDDIGIGGTWYFAGVEANSGPRSRAAFIGRASAVSLSYSRGDGDSSTNVTSTVPGFPDQSFRSDASSDSFSGNLRLVGKDSGWYGLASVSRTESEGDFPGLGATQFSSNAYGLGVGKYLGSQTALELNVARGEAQGFYTTIAALALIHIGAMGDTWQYGIDASLSDDNQDGSNARFGARFSLYPSRSWAFGADISAQLEDTSDGPRNYGLFASWFPTERVEIEARYTTTDVDVPTAFISNVDVDQYSYGAGVNVRF